MVCSSARSHLVQVSAAVQGSWGPLCSGILVLSFRSCHDLVRLDYLLELVNRDAGREVREDAYEIKHDASYCLHYIQYSVYSVYSVARRVGKLQYLEFL